MPLSPEEQAELASLEKNLSSGVYDSQDLIQKISRSAPVNVVLDIGDTLSNMTRKPFYSATGNREKFAPASFGPGNEMTKLGTEMAVLGAINPATALGRVAFGTGAGALLGEDLLGGATEGALWSSAFETVPYVGKGLRGISDALNLEIYSKNLMENMRNQYLNAKDTALTYLEPILERHGNKKIGDFEMENLLDTYSKYKEDLGTSNDLLIEDFFASNHTINDAQKLQSILGQEVRKLDETNVASFDRIKAVNKVRDSVLDSMYQMFDQIDINNTLGHLQFRDIWAKDVVQYEKIPTISNVVHGKTHGITPKKLETGLMKGTQGDKPEIMQGHKLHEQASQMHEKMGKADLYSNFAKVGAAGAAGSMGGSLFGIPGIFAAALPAMTQIGPSLGKIFTNEKVGEFAGKHFPKVSGAGLALTPTIDREGL